MRLVKLGRSVLLERFTQSQKFPLQLPTDYKTVISKRYSSKYKKTNVKHLSFLFHGCFDNLAASA